MVGPLPSMTGRVLHELLCEEHSASSAPHMESEELQTGLNSYLQELHRVRVGDVVYIEGASATGGDAISKSIRPRWEDADRL